MTNQQNPFPPAGGRPTPAATTAALPVVPKPPRARRGVLLATTLVIAVLALVVGVAGVALAAIALGRSDRAVSLAGSTPDSPAPVHPATTPVAGEAGPTGTAGPPDGGPSSSPTEISPTAQFTVAYQGEHLRIRSPGCGLGDQTYVDLDEPRVTGTSDANTEFGYADCDPGHLTTGLSFGQVPGADATPADCLETIRTDPGRSPVAPSTGMTLCFVTSQDAASNEGISQKLVFLTVDSISDDNHTGVLNVTAKAWAVPR